MLIPSANYKGNELIGKDRFVLSSSRTGQADLGHYEFLGILMGICIRTGANLILDLPQIVWK